ncbi:MAG: radical SAM protein, partial [Thermoguttaceae bacterium]
ESYRTTGYNEIALLGLSTSDYPEIEHLLGRLHEVFRPLGVSISLPSLRVNRQWRSLGELLNTDRRDGLTLAPEAARDDMRELIGKRISNDDLMAGCRRAMENGFARVKLYFMCGLPGERPADLDGIIDMAESISRLGKEVLGRFAAVVANVSNFVPKPQTPFQWNAMQRREYFQEAHERLRRRKRMRSVTLRCHDVDSSLLEGVLCRGDRRVGAAIELAWRRGARLDAWAERLQPALWWQALADCGIDVDDLLHSPALPRAALPWDHIGIQQGRGYLASEQEQSLGQMANMGCASDAQQGA